MITQHTGVVKGFSHPSLFPSGKCVGGYVETFVTIVIILVPTMSDAYSFYGQCSFVFSSEKYQLRAILWLLGRRVIFSTYM